MKKLFTLIELIVVIVVLGILAVIVVPNIKDMKERATVAALEADAQNIELAVDVYALKNNNAAPTEDGTPVLKGGEAELILLDLLDGYLKKESQFKDKYVFFLIEGGDVIYKKKGVDKDTEDGANGNGSGGSGTPEDTNNPSEGKDDEGNNNNGDDSSIGESNGSGTGSGSGKDKEEISPRSPIGYTYKVDQWTGIATVNLFVKEQREYAPVSFLLPNNQEVKDTIAKFTVDKEGVYSVTVMYNDGNTEKFEVDIDINLDFGYDYHPSNGGIVIKSYNGTEVNLVIPETIEGKKVVEIKDNALSPLTKNNFGGSSVVLESVKLPNTLVTIGPLAFAYNNLKEVNIPNSVVEIQPSAFESNNLSEVSLGSGLQKIDYYAFYGNKIQTLVIPTSVKDIGYRAFYNTGIVNLEFAEGTEGLRIGEEAFAYNTLKDLVVPAGIAYMDRGAFYYSNIGKLEVHSAEVGESAFESSNVTELVLAEGVKILKDFAFYSNKLSELNIPSTLTGMGRSAFYENNLVEVTIPSNVSVIGQYAFYFNPTETVYNYTKINNATIHNAFTSYPNVIKK